MNKNSSIYIAGHNGMVGSAIFRKLLDQGFNNIITKSFNELDLRVQKDVNSFFESSKPEYVFLAAAKVGGIYANNKFKAEFIYDNLMIQNNIIHASHVNKVKKLLFLGSSCIYPKLSPQPISEKYLLSGYLEPTNKPYAIAKIAGIEMCETYRFQYGCNFISAMPTNLYGTNDNYHPQNSHVLPALVRKVVLAKRNNEPNVIVWGSGSPMREFLHVNDLADATIFLMNNYNSSELINVGSGEEVTIRELIYLITSIIGYEGKIIFDNDKPDGTPRKMLDSSKIKSLGWEPKINLKEGIKKTVKEFLKLKV